LQGPFWGLCLCPGKLRFPAADTGAGRDSVRMLGVAAAMPQHVRVNFHVEPGSAGSTLHHRLKAAR
jgi:hypothetical protein